MGTVSDKLTYLNTTKSKIKESINLTGANLTNETFREYATTLKDTLAHILKNPSPIWDNFPKTTGTGSSIQVNTYNSLLDYSLDGNTTQYIIANKNLLNYSLAKIKTYNTSGTWSSNVYTINNLTFTINDDLTIKVNGTASATTDFDVNQGVPLAVGTYKIIGTPSTGGSNTYKIQVVGAGTTQNESGSGTTFTTSQAYTSAKLTIKIYSGIQMNNQVFKPMITTDTTLNYNSYVYPTGGSGSPSPDYPQPINVITGLQEVEITSGTTTNTYEINLGKNLYDNTHLTSVSHNDITAVNDNGTITCNGTASANAFLNISTSSGKVLLPKGTYTLSANNSQTISSGGYLRLMNSNGTTFDSTTVDLSSTNAKRTFTFTEDTIVLLQLRFGSGDTLNDFIVKPQLEKGSKATSFSPYFTPIELNKISTYKDYIFKGKGINLANIDDIKIGKQWNNADNSSRATILDIPIKKGQNYSLTSSWTNSHITQIRGAFFVSGYLSVAVPNSYPYYNEEKDYVSIEILADTTFTSDMLNGVQIMLNEGNSTTYEPYNAKDKWLLHKEIGKIILNGSETGWFKSGTNTFNSYGVSNNNTGLPIITSNSLCNYFKYSTNNANNSYWSGNNSLYLVFPSSSEVNTLDLFKSWLSTHNTIVYYVLNTPTTTEITNSELLEDLDSIELLDGLNNIMINGDLSAIMNLTCLEKE